MATVPLIVDGTTYNYSLNNDNSPWGEENTAWSIAVTDVLNTLQGPGDILQTVALIANNQISPVNVTGLAFSPSMVRGAIIEYTVYRMTTGSGASELVEVGTMYVSYKSIANTWDVAVVGGQGSGVSFTMSTTGVVQYTSSNMSGSAYQGTMNFRARAITQ